MNKKNSIIVVGIYSILSILIGMNYINIGINNVILSSGLTIAMLIWIIFVMKKQMKAENKQVVGWLLFLTYMTVYFIIRITSGSLSPIWQQEFRLNSNEIANVTSFFSLGYGIAQFITGFIMKKLGPKTIGIYAVMVGLVAISLSMAGGVSTLLTFRALLGVFCSCGAIGYYFYLANAWKQKYFGILASVGLIIAMNLGAAAAQTIPFGSSMIENLTFTVDWRIFYKVIGALCTVLGIILFGFLRKIKEKQDNNTVEKVSSFSLIAQPKTICLLIFSASSVMFAYAIQDGWLRIFTTYSKEITDNATFLNNSLIALATSLLPFVATKISYGLLGMIFGGSILLVTSLFFITNQYLLYIAILAMGLVLSCHNIPQYKVGETEKPEVAGPLLGMLNGSAMLFGCFGGQKLAGILINHSYETRVLSSMKPITLNHLDFLYMTKWMMMITAIGMLSAFIIWKIERKQIKE